MAVKYSPRQLEILLLLAKYGVLGTVTIQMLLKEVVAMDKLRLTLKVMERRFMICRTLFHPGGTPMSHWMLPEDKKSQSQALKATGLDERFLRRKAVRYSHIPHEIVCTLVQASLERQMPKLWIAREATGGFDNLPNHLLSRFAKEKGYKPDLCLGIPNELGDSAHSTSAFRWIAVEVDRSYRSQKRIAQRLNVYTKHTAFSGLLYLMPTVGTQATLQRIYDTRGGKDNLRLHGSSKAFLAIGTVPDALFDVNAKSVWCGPQEISLATWLSLFMLREAEHRDRALSDFASVTDA
jgi:hypothetical protein